MKYNIVILSTKSTHQVEGEPVTVDGVPCGIHFDKDLVSFKAYETWIVTELSTGAEAGAAIKKTEAIERAEKNIRMAKKQELWNGILDNAKGKLKQMKIKYPVNP